MEWNEQIQVTAASRASLYNTGSRRYFGGGGSKIKTVDPLAGTGVRELYSQLNSLIGPQLGQSSPVYGGQTVAGASPLQQAGFNAAGSLAPVAAGGLQFGQGVQQSLDPNMAARLLGGAEGALGDILSPADPAAVKSYWNQAFVDPAMRNLNDNLIPAVSERFASGGSHGAANSGAFNRSIGRTVENVAGDVNAQLENLLFGTTEAAKNRQVSGVQLAGNLAGQPNQIFGQAENFGLNPLSALLNIGGTQRGITGQQLTGDYQKWLSGQAYSNPWLNLLPSALSQPGMEVINQQQGPGASALLGPLGMAAGGFLSSPAGAGMLASGLSGLGGAAAGGLGALAALI